MPSFAKDVLIETYMRGECHVHAIAAQRQHGGGFAVAYDDTDIYFDDEDESVSSVVHVWSVHETPEGTVARDVLGDIPFTPDAMIDHLEQFFPGLMLKFEHGDAWIDMQATIEEIRDLAGDGDHQPLSAIEDADLENAASLDTVRVLPGARRLATEYVAEHVTGPEYP